MTRDEAMMHLCACFGVSPSIADFNIVGVNAVLDAVIAAEREACAKVCWDAGLANEMLQAADLCFGLSEAIRARGQA